ncbi:glycosyltransferase family 2 protein [Enterococcus sp. BWT-B8]|uniref:glycosyltransferase family 2 protein n=1 Tax=Enterococcus sp. BWT-B8 TaxID=2885157 RepID=UPI001E3FF701|nr:glycosyltransferase family 2 protein [Enterococcus sp. BWT-B8]MCB5953244.1 glycosyltransferase family 2 protein [Enterococcus sp. BWT-B8]
MNNNFWIRNDRFHLKDTTKYIIDAWLKTDQTLRLKLDDQLLNYILEEPDEIQDNSIGRFVKIIVTLPLELEGYHSLKILSLIKGEEELSCEIGVPLLLQKRYPIQVFYDKSEVDFVTKTCRIEGWMVSDKPVHIELKDNRNKSIEYELERVKRRDILALFPEYDLPDENGFVIKFHYTNASSAVLSFSNEEFQINKEIQLSKSYYRKERFIELAKKAREVMKTQGIVKMIQSIVGKIRRHFDSNAPRPVNYQEWISIHLPGKSELAEQKKTIFENQPLISIVVPLYKTSEYYLNQLVDSVKTQTYENWELCLSDGSGEHSPIRGILEKFEKSDERIKVVHNEKQLHISENTNAVIRIATGDYIAFADHDDVLTPNALYENVRLINNHPNAEVIYSDEDKVYGDDQYVQPHFKPDFSIDMLCSVNYICHFLVVKKNIIEQVGMLRSEYDGAQDYDFVLRCVEATEHVYHIPKILYHWRISEESTAENPESKEYAVEAGRKAVQAHYDRIGVEAVVEKGKYFGLYRTRLKRKNDPLVSIIIPNKDHIEDLQLCINSLEEKSTYKNIEYIIVENNSTEDGTFAYYKQLQKENSRVKLVSYEGKFNYSAINNYGVSFAKGDYYLFMNNDVEIINPETIEELLNYAMREDVGVVGSRLYYPDGTIQHAGVVVGFGGIAGHTFVNQKPTENGYFNRIIVAQNYSAVTAACMMVRGSVFKEVHGFSEELAVAFNDIDFCLKVRTIGKLVVYNPYAELYHYESKSRGAEDTPEKIQRFQNEIAVFERKWPEILAEGDPYYNVNLSLDTQDFSLKMV